MQHTVYGDHSACRFINRRYVACHFPSDFLLSLFVQSIAQQLIPIVDLVFVFVLLSDSATVTSVYCHVTYIPSLSYCAVETSECDR